MQKVLRRSELVHRQAARKAVARKRLRYIDERRLRKDQETQIIQLNNKDIRAERKARREDWVQGPLAPKRDVGDAGKVYGAVEPRRIRGVDKSRFKKWGIVAGDRVVIVKEGHKDQGKIGKVSEVKVRAEECTVEGLNMVDVALPEYMLAKDIDKTPYRAFNMPLPLSDVRLVAPLPHPETGVVRDVVIKELQTVPQGRIIAGVVPATRIPYPERKKIEHEDHDVDTLRIEVESRTWVPTLRDPPMPPSIIDELRNKYSKFRTRHDDEFIAKKQEEDYMADVIKRASSKRMLTPLKELHRRERAEKKAMGQPELSEDMLAKIGEVMVRNMGELSIERDVSEVNKEL